MSLFDSFDENRTAALNPWDVYQPVEDMPKTVLVTFRKAVLDIARSQYKATRVATLESGGSLEVYRLHGAAASDRKRAADSECASDSAFTTGSESGVADAAFSDRKRAADSECASDSEREADGAADLAIYRTTMGAAMTIALMEEVIAMGGRNFIFFGSCGTLDSSISAGHLIVPTDAYRDEGISYHYMATDEGDYIEVPTANETEDVLKAMGLAYTKTRVWTTDALYRETRRNMERRRSEGCGVVDMECAAIMAAARFRGVKAYQFLYAEDNLDAVVWDPRTMGKVPTSASELYLRVALEIGRHAMQNVAD